MKVRNNYTLMIKSFVKCEDFVKDRHTKAEQDKVTKSGAYYIQFNLWQEIILSAEVELRTGDSFALKAAAENLKSQLYKMYKKKNTRKAEFLFDADFNFDLNDLNDLLI